MATGDGSPTSGGSGDSIATEDTYTATQTGISGVKVGVSKLRTGSNDQDTGDVTRGNPLPVFDGLNSPTQQAILAALQQIVSLLQGQLDVLPRPIQANSSITSVVASTTPTLLMGTNVNRVAGSGIVNDSTSTSALAVLLSNGNAAASAGAYTVSIAASGYYELPAGYFGPVYGVWTTAVGFCNCTEMSRSIA